MVLVTRNVAGTRCSNWGIFPLIVIFLYVTNGGNQVVTSKFLKIK